MANRWDLRRNMPTRINLKSKPTYNTRTESDPLSLKAEVNCELTMVKV